MKKTVLFIFLFLSVFQLCADELSQVAAKYRAWIIGNEQTDYTNPLIQTRYKSILEYIESAEQKYNNFTFTPDEKFDFSTKPNQSEARSIFADILFPLSLGYHLPGDANTKNPFYQNAATKEKILKMFKYLRIKGWKEGINMRYKSMDTYKETGIVGFGGSMGNNFLGYSLSLFLNKELLAENNLLADELKTLNWISNVVGPQYDFPKLWEVTGYNADGVRAMLNNRLCYILSLPENHPNRLDEAKYFSRIFNKSLQIADGWADLIKSDYMGYHHKNTYLSAYAPNAYHTASLMIYLLNRTSFQVDDKAIENLSQAILTMRIYSNKYDCPRALAGRFPGNLGVLVQNLPCFIYMAEVDSPYQDQLKSAFKRLWDPNFEAFTPDYVQNVNCRIMYFGSIGAMQLAIDCSNQNIEAEDDPNGFWYYPYGGLGIYRKDNWLLSFKGNSKYIWDFEASRNENLYGRFVSAGALRILAGGNPVSAKSSGYTINGWDWTRLPGATTFDMPFDELKSRKTRSFTPESYLGGVAIDGKNAFVSMKYDAPLSSLSLNKSFFFFDSYVVAMGTNINAPKENYLVQTTLYQNGIENLQVATSLNAQEVTGTQQTVLEESNIFLTDAQGHAYFIPGSSKLAIERANQTAPLDNGKKDKSGDFASARLLHGANPENASYLYFIQVNGGMNGSENLAKQHANLFTIIQQDKNAHIVRYKNSRSTAYALLEGNQTTNDELIVKTDTPCLVMIKEQGEKKISLAIQNPELGKIDEMITYGEINNHWHDKSTVQPVNIILSGNWKLSEANKEVIVVSNQNNETVIKFDCFDGKPLKVELVENYIKSTSSRR